MDHVTIRTETMCGFFTKYHLNGLPRAAVLHHFTDVDRGPPHDHPWPFRSFIISGSYTEEVFQLDGSSERVSHMTGEAFSVASSHIHRIVHMPASGVWTLILPGRPERKSGFYDFREDGAYHRFWDQPEFKRIEAGAGQVRAA